MRYVKPLAAAVIAQALVAGCYMLGDRAPSENRLAVTDAELVSTSWESRTGAAGCRQALALAHDGTYRLTAHCDGSSESVAGTYTVHGTVATLAAPRSTTCADGDLTRLFATGALEAEPAGQGGLALFRGHALLQTLHRAADARATAHETKAACVHSGALVAVSTD